MAVFVVVGHEEVVTKGAGVLQKRQFLLSGNLDDLEADVMELSS
ncbi:hypothetical protein [Actinocrispum sp. NPDC049592]